MASHKQRSLLKKLRGLSFGQDGYLCAKRIQAIAREFSKNPTPSSRNLLKAYHAIIRREFSREQAVVEYYGQQVAVAELSKQLSSYYGRPVRVITVENADLIAGVRIRIGDDIWDGSIAGRLHTLSQNLN